MKFISAVGKCFSQMDKCINNKALKLYMIMCTIAVSGVFCFDIRNAFKDNERIILLEKIIFISIIIVCFFGCSLLIWRKRKREKICGQKRTVKKKVWTCLLIIYCVRILIRIVVGIIHIDFIVFIKNFIIIVMWFWGYCLAVWKKRKREKGLYPEQAVQKKVKICLQIFTQVYCTNIGITAFLTGMTDIFITGLSHGKWEYVYIEYEYLCVGIAAIGISIAVLFILFKKSVYIFYPISVYCALYAYPTGHCIGGLSGAGAIVLMWFIALVSGFLESLLSIYANFHKRAVTDVVIP